MQKAKIKYYGKGVDAESMVHIEFILNVLMIKFPLSPLAIQDIPDENNSYFILTDKFTFDSDEFQETVLELNIEYLCKHNINNIQFCYGEN